jgi:hypothetical protein
MRFARDLSSFPESLEEIAGDRAPAALAFP